MRKDDSDQKSDSRLPRVEISRRRGPPLSGAIGHLSRLQVSRVTKPEAHEGRTSDKANRVCLGGTTGGSHVEVISL